MGHGLRVALVGHGRWGSKLCRALGSLADVEVCGICDLIDTDTGGIPRFDRFDSLLQRARPQAVLISTPSELHGEMAHTALSAGVHTFVEKPMALSLADAEALARCAEQNARTLMVGHILHHDAAVAVAFGLLRAGAIGAPALCLSERRNEARRRGLQAWWELGPHDVSLTLRVMGAEPHWVQLRRDDDAGPAALDATLQFAASRARVAVGYGHGRARRMAWVGEDAALLLGGEGGALQLWQLSLVRERASELIRAASVASSSELWQLLAAATRGRTALHVPTADALRGELAHFVDCARHGRRPLCDEQEGLRVVRVLATGERSLYESVRVCAAGFGRSDTALSDGGAGFTAIKSQA